MEFFHNQDTLTSIQWILRAIVAYYFLLFAAKIMGQRSISQLGLLDFFMALVIGNILAHPLSDEGLGLKGSMITTSVLVFLYIFHVFLSLKWKRFRSFIEPAPFPLIKDGQIKFRNLTKARITIDYLLSHLRKEKIEEIHMVALALWKPDGVISFFVKPQYESITPKDMGIPTKPFGLPQTIILEGKIEQNELNRIGKDECWLKKMIKQSYNSEISDILLATVDQNLQVKVYLYK